METLLPLLPAPQPAAIRYGVTAALVLLTFLLRMGIQERTGVYGFILFIPAVMASSIVFGRRAGLFALALSVALIAGILRWPGNVTLHIAALASFAIVGAGLVVVSDGLRRTLARAQKAERDKDLLLEEMTHRVKNKFATISSVIGVQARQSTPEIRAALEAVGRRVRAIADVHDHLQLARHEGVVDMAAYLGELCRSLSSSLRNLRPVTVAAAAEPIVLPPEKALSIGLIVNELITNAFKYAFPADQSGHVLVRLTKAGSEVQLTVADDGVGCPDRTDTGLGTKLVTLLAAQLGGSATWDQTNPGCKASVTFPMA